MGDTVKFLKLLMKFEILYVVLFSLCHGRYHCALVFILNITEVYDASLHQTAEAENMNVTVFMN